MLERSAEPGSAPMLPLTAASLPALPDDLPRPRYDRTTLRTGIVHIGVGGFHRAHQAMYLDRLLRAGTARDWAICGVGVLDADERMRRSLHAQDCLYTLVVKGPDGTRRARVIGAIREYLFAPDDPAAVVAKLADPDTRIVSLTVTEGGYQLDPQTGRFDPSDPMVAADLVPGAAPRGLFGLITAGLAARRARGVAPFTIMSCDNIEANGDTAREAFAGFADLREPGLGDWIRAEVRFPHSMVDRITPVTTDADRAELRERYGVDDHWPVVCEPFTQWVLQDDFGLGRPPWADVGVQLVADVAPYELMKLRLLNAGHQALAYFGYLAGYRLVHEAAQDPVFARFLLDYLVREATPTLAPVPGIDLDAYRHELVARFGNAQIRDTIARLCADTSDRIPKWLLPVIRHNLRHGGEVRRAAAIVASWARYAEGGDEQGQPIEVVDRQRERLQANARRQHADPGAFLADRGVFGDLVDAERFVTAYTWALDSLHARGARATLAELVA